ncbi:flagellar hook protein FlgE|uniref:Flagellar hook protein FlgE n=1 Tax=Brenneria salicis ATCC 15712 = DSM 30166 TaxID=714314 RepID=A0A366I586_9GAMM|nr:flagellar hook protein FlgE [Brenneria salicis]NMN91158.1 flagellar hook protein FlgE [Brenneria salicis ATCC 15712 = DSM 30166]RBP62314.1 flagellar hook protein FlgE [Brenneria salicis ATCC 15712 = DSM 30166]RLM30557.1 flagellar hook protein FlgE [Brenneria salicis ATCC 15712 = DSM 30166]
MGFSQAVSGLNAASNNLDVIGNNIANSATVGFKAGTISFADMFAGSKVGMGTQVAAVLQDFSNGTVTSSSRDLDIAISGNGFFRVQDTNGSIYYSRNGQFTLDGSRNIVNMQGMQLTGYPATGTPPTIQQGADPVALTIPEDAMSAQATTVASIIANLNSSDDAMTWDAANPADTSNYKGSITTYDSLGNAHDFAMYFVKTAANEWDVHVQDTSTGAAFQNYSLSFDSNGALTTTTPITIAMASLNGSEASNFTLNFAGSVQQNSDSSTKTPTQNGYAPGELTGYSINDDGTVVGTYSNQKQQVLGQIVLASFANPEGLSPEGDNVWSATDNSGQAVVNLAGTGNLGKLIGQATESSNVDMSKELVNMIVAQRNYQANSQTIKTQDAILQTLVSLR